MLEFLKKIMSDVVVDPMPTTAAALEGVGEAGSWNPELWIFLVLLLVVVALCFVFILNNKSKKKLSESETGEEQKSSR